MEDKSDPSTLSNYEFVLATKLHLDIDVSFATKKLSTITQTSFTVKQPVEKILLDTENVKVSKVEVDVDDTDLFKEATFEMLPDTNYIGQALSIEVPKSSLPLKAEQKVNSFFI